MIDNYLYIREKLWSKYNVKGDVRYQVRQLQIFTVCDIVYFL